MGASDNTMSGKTWIGKSRHAFCVRTVRHFEAQQRRALESGNIEAAERYRLWGLGFLHETEEIDTEAARLRAAQDEAQQAAADAERLTALKKKLGITPRANGSAYHPFRGGLPTLGKDR
ncbi:hypothetical protein [Streptomyces sp. NRRL B-3229]|uniref:hypothetical protein n=1 Tax=Streptomyces sp. NRRL B-3229 TaxID=1463836 RepID=UPI0004C0A8CC|nr:hypothetical protein [Streptomyces sp. NRRL B-3229]